MMLAHGEQDLTDKKDAERGNKKTTIEEKEQASLGKLEQWHEDTSLNG